MSNRTFHLILGLAAIAGAASQPPPPVVHFDQAGYQAGLPVAIVLGRDGAGTLAHGEWTVVDSAKGRTVAKGALPAAKWWSALQDSATVLSLDTCLPVGAYQLRLGKSAVGRFSVRGGADLDLFRMAMRGFYHNRASTATTPEFAGKWARAAGHPDTLVFRHPFTGQTGTLSSPKGWYDAGDYGKYIVNSGISCWLLLDLAERAPAVFDTLSWPIPASPDPALLREVRWNLEWMLTMQDLDGGVYHKLTTLKFDPFERPDQDTGRRFVVQKTTAAALDFAAVAAKASRVWAARDPTFSKTCLRAAEGAWAWAVAHPGILYRQPSDVKTGKYEDEEVSDERLLAAVELALTRGDSAMWVPFRQELDSSRKEPWWQDVAGLALYEVVDHPGFFARDTASAKANILARARELRERGSSTAFGISMDSTDFLWGSNSVLAHQGIHLLRAFEITGDRSFLRAARSDLGYLLGANPYDSSFVTGVGAHPAMHPHHRPSASDTVVAPVPGFLVGGSNPKGQDVGPNPWQCRDYRKAGKPALAWTDEQCSYASNEIAINWNAALVHFVGAFVALRDPSAGCISRRP